MAVTISSSLETYCFLPCQQDVNFETFLECMGKLSASIEDSDMYNYIILGVFNSAVDTPFESELVEFCSSYDLIISDYHRYGRASGQFTKRITVLLDSTISFVVMIFSVKFQQLKYQLDKLPGSDHLHLQMTLLVDIDFNSVVDFIDNSCPGDKASFIWSKCTPNELSQYCCLTYELFTDINLSF